MQVTQNLLDNGQSLYWTVARQRSGAQMDNIRKYKSKVCIWNKRVWLNKKALDEANLFYYELSSLYSKIWLFTKNTKI